MTPQEFMAANKERFGQDPFGYSALAWYKWGMAQALAGYNVDPTKPPSGSDLKSPILWLCQAQALTEAATVVLRNTPSWERMPDTVKGVCDSQYCAVGLMLVGYSLEICLKAMLIISKGVSAYTADEKKYHHHRLQDLADFVPDLSAKDKAILRGLTHFVTWAGRYPDPGSGREDNAEEIFSLSEKHKVAAKDMFALAARVMNHSRQVVEKHAGYR